MLLSLFRVSGHSMEPTFRSGQILVVSSIPYFFREPTIGDIVVLKHPQTQRLLLKRIKKIENKKFFITGDNPEYSTDSRSFGPVISKKIVGKVIWS